MAVQVIREVDEVYDGVLRSRVCGRCRSRRPRLRSSGWSPPKSRKVVLFQITANGQFHMRLPSGPSDEALCGVAAR